MGESSRSGSTLPTLQCRWGRSFCARLCLGISWRTYSQSSSRINFILAAATAAPLAPRMYPPVVQTSGRHGRFNDLSAQAGDDAVRHRKRADPSLRRGNEEPAGSQSVQAPSRPRSGPEPVKTGRAAGPTVDAASADRRGGFVAD